jgi:large repetitive protein
VTFSATVSVQSPGAGIPTGVVTFTIDGGTTLTTTLNVGTGSMTTLALGIGSHTVTVTYSGDLNFRPSIGSLSPLQVVSKASTTIGIASSSNPSVFGQTVIFTATVSAQSPGACSPGGVVTFTIDGVNAGAVSLSSGIASVSTVLLGTGQHTVKASYGGDGSFIGSLWSLTPTQAVNKASTATGIVSSPNPAHFGQLVTFPAVFDQVITFTATVSAQAPGSGIPAGVVTFTIDGAATITASLSGGAASVTTSTLGVGSHTVAVMYGGSAIYNSS